MRQDETDFDFWAAGSASLSTKSYIIPAKRSLRPGCFERTSEGNPDAPPRRARWRILRKEAKGRGHGADDCREGRDEHTDGRRGADRPRVPAAARRAALRPDGWRSPRGARLLRCG